ncbi:hypothetical protein ZEAMMB73_Zm00001d004043 [Zea mays]|uniref:Uncharacterized protein n=1 Tax=Zea mays TaxID=4577 RepID=A0A1D6ED40_MAIZE|nr:hypothetical protein ZEAMMB73_Zm00001d004043 [Zea mays]
MAVEVMAMVTAVISIIHMEGVVHTDAEYKLKTRSLKTMIVRKDLMRIPLQMMKCLVGVIITDMLTLKIETVIMGSVIEMTWTILPKSSWMFLNLLGKKVQMNILIGLSSVIKFLELTIFQINIE